MTDDTHGSTIREMMKKSMEQPAGFKPLNHHKGCGCDYCWNRHDDKLVNFSCWVIAMVVVGCVVALVIHYGMR